MARFILAVHEQPTSSGKPKAWAAVGSDFIGPLHDDDQVAAVLQDAKPGHYLVLEGGLAVVNAPQSV